MQNAFPVIEKDLTIINMLGLHARACAKFVKLTAQFECQIEVESQGRCVNGKSIMGIMMLAASKGHSITVRATGPDAQQAIDALSDLINQRFGEQE